MWLKNLLFPNTTCSMYIHSKPSKQALKQCKTIHLRPIHKPKIVVFSKITQAPSLKGNEQHNCSSDLQANNTTKLNTFVSSAHPQVSKTKSHLFIMDMRKVTCAILIAAASVSATMAAAEVPAPAPGPSSGASAAFPLVGSLVGASVLSFFALFH